MGGDRHILRESTVATVCVPRPKESQRVETKAKDRERERASDREMGRHGWRGRVHLLCDSDGEHWFKTPNDERVLGLSLIHI